MAGISQEHAKSKCLDFFSCLGCDLLIFSDCLSFFLGGLFDEFVIAILLSARPITRVSTKFVI